jgi:hypothetical protein
MNYRKVKASRLPKKDGYYTAYIEDERSFIAHWKDNKWWADDSQDGKTLFGLKDNFIKSWLEPIPPISEGEIERLAQQYVEDCQPLPLGADAGVKQDFKEGFRTAINLINKER